MSLDMLWNLSKRGPMGTKWVCMLLFHLSLVSSSLHKIEANECNGVVG